MDYDINYLMGTLNNIKNNPYGIRDTDHYLRRSAYRDVDLNVVNEKLLSEIPVGIQKTLGYNNRFELIFEYTEYDDLYIVLDIINSDEVAIITAIPKSKEEALMKSKLNYVYDSEYDLMDITIDESHKYQKSIDITNGIILDLDENCFPAALEIISASKILGIDKQYLISPNIDMSIIISEELICIELKFTYFVSKHMEDVCFKQNLANNYGIPAMETIFSTA